MACGGGFGIVALTWLRRSMCAFDSHTPDRRYGQSGVWGTFGQMDVRRHAERLLVGFRDKLIDPHTAGADGRWGRIVNAEHGSTESV